jgi:hypothetical protein
MSHSSTGQLFSVTRNGAYEEDTAHVIALRSYKATLDINTLLHPRCTCRRTRSANPDWRWLSVSRKTNGNSSAIRWRAVEDVIAHWNPCYIPWYEPRSVLDASTAIPDADE